MPDPKTKTCPRCRGTKRYNKKPCQLCKGKGELADVPWFASATHVAGKAIEVHGRVIQRCVVCGHKLTDLLVVEQPKDGRGKPAFWTWSEGDLVRVPIDCAEADQGNKSTGKPALVGHANSDPLPADFCIGMVEQG